jgi:penicillin-binding protein 2
MSGWNLRTRVKEIAPEEIFLDSSNLPGHESSQFEGRVVPTLSRRASVAVGVFFVVLAIFFSVRSFSLQVVSGTAYAAISLENTLDHSVIFSTRGLILDRTGKKLAWNEASEASLQGATTTPYALRKYTTLPGFSLLLGFVAYPKADASGDWWRDNYTAMSGIELSFDETLAGVNGSRMIETDAHGALQRENIISPPRNGADLTLSIDSDLQTKLYTLLSAHAADQGFQGGAAVIMDVRTGELLAMTSFPQYDNNAFTDGDVTAVRWASNNASTPLLNRAISGLYAPGSIVKPIFAAAALNEGIISPDKIIVSTGAISIPNPYDHAHPSLFRDWMVHGAIDMRTALAVSSDEYFYTIGGGYAGQQGLGITKLDQYARLFGLGSTTGIAFRGEQDGLIPTPQWKASVFPEDPLWRIGDTYHTAIGQYGFQLTPIQAVRYAAAIANGGKLMTPQLTSDLPAGRQGSTPQFTTVGIPDQYLQIVREGMRLAVTSNRSDATVKFFNIKGIELAAKTGTAQIGAHNEYMNSWSIGFWPASNPHYAYAVVLERARAGTPSGAAPGMLPFFQWLIANHPEYVN